MKITAKHIIDLLKTRHKDDLFITECKTGSSSRGCLRLDGWAMKKSWSYPLNIGYEIKISRTDYLNDKKWRGYLPYCNEFYFVCPSKLIQPEELPDDTGLIWVTSTGTKLYIKKRPVYRKINIPENFYRYILMCRTKICHTYNTSQLSNLEYWKNWLDTHKTSKELGYRVSRKIQNIIKTEIEEVERQNRRLREQNLLLQEVKDFLKQMNIDPEKYFSVWTVERRIEDRIKAFPTSFTANLTRLYNDIGEVLSGLKK